MRGPRLGITAEAL